MLRYTSYILKITIEESYSQNREIHIHVHALSVASRYRLLINDFIQKIHTYKKRNYIICIIIVFAKLFEW